MKRTPMAWFCGALCLAMVAGFSACGGANTPNGFGKDSGGPPPAPDSGGDAAEDHRLPHFHFDAGPDGPSCPGKCSADLHKILDCNGNVVQTCPASQGCGGMGTCVPACEAAADNKSTIGCDYYSVDVAGGPGLSDGSCFAAYIANTWDGPVTITAEYNGMPLSLASAAVTPSGTGKAITYTPLPGGVLAQGQLAILFLAQSPSGFGIACPAPAALAMDVQTDHGSAIVNGFHITTTAPVVAYDIFPYGGAAADLSSATLLVPTTAWGTNYVAVDAFSASGTGFAGLWPYIQIAAAENGTQVTLSPTVPIVGGPGVAPAAMGVPTIYNLNAGQVLQLMQPQELNGTAILANKPIGVWGGANCMNIDPMDPACDSGHQEIFPVSALGNEYVAVRYRPRDPAQPNEAPPWRIMGTVNGTVLTYDPPTPPIGAPTTLSTGQLVMFYSSGPFVVKSQDNKHPFYMSAHMGGEEFMAGNYLSGDPEFVNVTPPAEYLASYIFMTDPTFGNTNLVLVRQKNMSGAFEDVMLDCVSGPVTGWTPVGTAGQYEYAWVDLLIASVPQGSCNNGYHTITSPSPFGLTVWGWDQYDSYAFTAGASVQPINTVVVPPIPVK